MLFDARRKRKNALLRAVRLPTLGYKPIFRRAVEENSGGLLANGTLLSCHVLSRAFELSNSKPLGFWRVEFWKRPVQV